MRLATLLLLATGCEMLVLPGEETRIMPVGPPIEAAQAALPESVDVRQVPELKCIDPDGEPVSFKLVAVDDGKVSVPGARVGWFNWHADRWEVVRVVGLDPARSGAQIRASVSLASSTGPESALKVGAALSEVARYYPSWDADLTRQLLERFSLNVDKRISRLSTGEKARFRLVLALAFRPQIVFLDEPALGLDLTQRRALFETVLEIARDPERAVVISSHQLEDLERLADQLFVIADGRCVKQGHIDTLIDEGQTLEEALLKWGAA